MICYDLSNRFDAISISIARLPYHRIGNSSKLAKWLYEETDRKNIIWSNVIARYIQYGNLLIEGLHLHPPFQQITLYYHLSPAAFYVTIHQLLIDVGYVAFLVQIQLTDLHVMGTWYKL